MSIYLQYKAIDLEKKYNPVTYWHKHDSFLNSLRLMCISVLDVLMEEKLR